MMSVIKEETVKIRKPCECAGCGHKYQVGERVRKTTWKGDSSLSTRAWCEYCTKWWETEANSIDCIDGIGMGVIGSEYPELFPPGWSPIADERIGA